MSILGAIAPATGDIISSAISARETGLNRDFNAAEAQKNRDWQEKMSNTAYQRAKTDMLAAGINPIIGLASNGGAATGGGSAASAGALPNIKGGENLNIKQIIESVKNTKANTEATSAQKTKTEHDTIKTDAEIQEALANAEKTKIEQKKELKNIENIDADTELKYYQTGKEEYITRKIKEEINKLIEEVNILKKQGKYYEADRKHKLINQYADTVIRGIGEIGALTPWGGAARMASAMSKRKQRINFETGEIYD